MPKDHLYDETPTSTKHTSTGTPCPCKQGGCQPRYYTRGLLPGQPRVVGAPTTAATPVTTIAAGGTVPVQRVSPPSSRGGGSVR